MKYNELLIGIGMFVIAHILAFFQLNGQFIWKWFGKNEVLVAAFGFIISFFYIWGTKYTVNGFEGLLWPARFIGFGIGMVIYAIAVSYYFNEGITAKTFISLFLSVILICIQVLWKN
jgi:hypothetical protein